MGSEEEVLDDSTAKLGPDDCLLRNRVERRLFGTSDEPTRIAGSMGNASIRERHPWPIWALHPAI